MGGFSIGSFCILFRVFFGLFVGGAVMLVLISFMSNSDNLSSQGYDGFRSWNLLYGWGLAGFGLPFVICTGLNCRSCIFEICLSLSCGGFMAYRSFY